MKYSLPIVLQWFAEHGLTPTPEHKFHPERKWRFDFAFPQNKLALEVEGGAFTGGRHTRASGFLKDMEKYNSATLMGWRILRCIPDDLCTTDTLEMLREALSSN